VEGRERTYWIKTGVVAAVAVVVFSMATVVYHIRPIGIMQAPQWYITRWGGQICVPLTELSAKSLGKALPGEAVIHTPEDFAVAARINGFDLRQNKPRSAAGMQIYGHDNRYYLFIDGLAHCRDAAASLSKKNQ
jgi:hypothetical protein